MRDLPAGFWNSVQQAAAQEVVRGSARLLRGQVVRLVGQKVDIRREYASAADGVLYPLIATAQKPAVNDWVWCLQSAGGVVVLGRSLAAADMDIPGLKVYVDSADSALGTRIDTTNTRIDTTNTSVTAVSNRVTPLERIADERAYINMMPDSGRYAGKINPMDLMTRDSAGALKVFENSRFFLPFNSTTVSQIGKFIWNNTTNGGASTDNTAGTAGALTQAVQDLLAVQGRTGSAARYGVEYFVARYQMGAGTSDAAASGGATRYLMTTNAPHAMYGGGRVTMAFWIRFAAAGGAWTQIAIHNLGKIIRDGVDWTGDLLLSVADGWTHVVIHHESILGYTTSFPFIRARNGDVVQIAIPAIFPGFVYPPMHSAPYPTMNELSF